MKKVMKLIDPSTGLMECKVCGATHFASLQPDKKIYYRGSWQCQNKCKVEDLKTIVDLLIEKRDLRPSTCDAMSDIYGISIKRMEDLGDGITAVTIGS